MGAVDASKKLASVDFLLSVTGNAAITEIINGVHTGNPSATPVFDHNLCCSKQAEERRARMGVEDLVEIGGEGRYFGL